MLALHIFDSLLLISAGYILLFNHSKMTTALLLGIKIRVIHLTVVASVTHTRLTLHLPAGNSPFLKLPTEITARCFEAKQVITLQSCTQDIR